LTLSLEPEFRKVTKKKKVPLRGWLVPPRPKKYQGWSVFCFSILYRVFELASPRHAQKRDKKKREKNGFGFFPDFFAKRFL
jgi:hypothetical protein